MTEHLPACVQCSSEYAYELGTLIVCPECGHEWSLSDANGTPLAAGDTVTIIKDLRIKGSSTSIKVDGFGPMNRKSSVVRKG